MSFWRGGWCWGRSGEPLCRLLLLLLLLFLLLLPCCRSRLYTNHWAVRIAGGIHEANRIASKYGYVNIGQDYTLDFWQTTSSCTCFLTTPKMGGRLYSQSL